MYYGVNAVDTNGAVAASPDYTAVVTDPNAVEHDPDNKDSDNNVLDPNGTNYVEGVDGDSDNGISAVTGAKIAAAEKHEGILLTLTGTANATISNVYLSLDYRQSSFHNGWVKVEGVLGKFNEILNDQASFNDLTEVMGDYNNSDRLNGSYVGNVNGAQVGSDDEAIEELFKDPVTGENYLFVDLDNDGNDDEVTVMIKAINLDDDTSTGVTIADGQGGGLFGGGTRDLSGAEMVIFITPAKLGTDDVNNGSYVITYIAPFFYNQQQDGTYKWEMVSEDLLAGVCSTNDYDGGIGSGNTSINTDTWRSTQTYNGVVAAYTLPESYDYTMTINGRAVNNTNTAAGIYQNGWGNYSNLKSVVNTFE